MEKTYASVNEIAKMYGISPQVVRQYCHAKGQDFAYQTKEKGKILIHIKRFDRFLTRRRPEYSRRAI